MRGLLWVLLLFALATGVALALQYNDGYVLLVTPPYRTELSLTLAILLVLLAFLLFYGILRAVALVRALPARVRIFRRRREQEKGADHFFQAQRLLLEGRYRQALRHAEAAFATGYAPALAAMLAADAAHHLEPTTAAQEWLARAVEADPQLQAAGLMWTAQMHLEQSEFGEAVDVLARLHRLSGLHIAALRLELRARQGRGEWDEVLRLARLLEKHQALRSEAAHAIKHQAHRENLGALRGDAGRLLDYWKRLPSAEDCPPLALAFVEALFDAGACEAAQRQIETQLEMHWDSRLLPFYAQEGGIDAAQRSARLEVWLAQHPDDAQLLLALGRLYLAQALRDKAQTCLEAALSRHDCRATRFELARLCEQTGRAEAALGHYRAAARQPD